MNRDHLVKESKKWVEEAIISEDQREQLMERYPKKQNKPMLLTFAALFIGLGFLTFVASNWSYLTDFGRMAILIFSMTAFYLAGDWVYRRKSNRVGISLILVAFVIFGSSIFLVGQMYHYTSFSAFPFFLWSLVGLGLLFLFKDASFFYATLIVVTIGQFYSGIVYQHFHIWLGLLFFIGLGWVVVKSRHIPQLSAFAISYVVHAIILVFSEGMPYYWLIVLFLLLYVVEDFFIKSGSLRVFKTLSMLSVFLMLIFQVFFLGNEYVGELTESSLYFFLAWAVLFVFSVVRLAMSSTNYYWIDLLLFVPVFRFEFGDGLSLLILFLYALFWLISGYHQEVSRWVNKGTIAFLLTTFIAYFQLAWDFMDRSLFFFIGGVLLFALSYFLEKKRRTMQRGGGEK
ncbi:Uncharacterized membrane protein [Halobacillus karajensis]|uniref:DUF2157 domain-containing protein n=1 Tax=Halobacillus karajensis TaxID=195088 RepID=UPI0008A7F13F|nr:DUF2157 domain-containing protein [Halobacillus karajensis]SEH96622.1 Uncharacterized membrane protein [Halobacillus karajensis]